MDKTIKTLYQISMFLFPSSTMCKDNHKKQTQCGEARISTFLSFTIIINKINQTKETGLINVLRHFCNNFKKKNKTNSSSTLYLCQKNWRDSLAEIDNKYDWLQQISRCFLVDIVANAVQGQQALISVLCNNISGTTCYHSLLRI